VKKTIREIQSDLKTKEKLSVEALLQIKGGDCGTEDKRKDI
jgi:hypothetical protein